MTTAMGVLEGIKVFGWGGTWLFVGSLGELTTIPCGKCRGLFIRSCIKRKRGDLSGVAPKKDEEFGPERFGCVMLEADRLMTASREKGSALKFECKVQTAA